MFFPNTSSEHFAHCARKFSARQLEWLCIAAEIQCKSFSLLQKQLFCGNAQNEKRIPRCARDDNHAAQLSSGDTSPGHTTGHPERSEGSAFFH
jgi:hypothetical protein